MGDRWTLMRDIRPPDGDTCTADDTVLLPEVR